MLYSTVYFVIRGGIRLNSLQRNDEILWLTILGSSISSLNTFQELLIKIVGKCKFSFSLNPPQNDMVGELKFKTLQP